jgi:hypothetical protein
VIVLRYRNRQDESEGKRYRIMERKSKYFRCMRYCSDEKENATDIMMQGHMWSDVGDLLLLN